MKFNLFERNLKYFKHSCEDCSCVVDQFSHVAAGLT